MEIRPQLFVKHDTKLNNSSFTTVDMQQETELSQKDHTMLYFVTCERLLSSPGYIVNKTHSALAPHTVNTLVGFRAGVADTELSIHATEVPALPFEDVVLKSKKNMFCN